MSSVSSGKGDAQGSTSGGKLGEGSLRLAQEHEVRAPVSVWIDLENCGVPRRANVCRLSCCITSSLKRLNYLGCISIFTYGDIKTVATDTVIALQQSGVTFVHVHHTGPNAAYRRMMTNFMIWSFDNPIPSNLLIILGDNDFWPSMRTLKNKGHNVMMAFPRKRYKELPPVDYVLSWEDLAEGRLAPAQIKIIAVT